MPNPDFQPVRRKIAAAPLGRPVRRMRVCAAQYLMRRIASWEDLQQSVEFFVVTADAYHCHFLLMPELFTAQMFTTMPDHWDARRSIAALAGLTDRYLAMFRSLATRYNLHIVGGSHPVLRDGKLYNVAHLFTPSGNIYTQDKLHITPSDFAFPLQATAGEAEPNVETVVIADLDFASLAQQREIGSVRPLQDRRPDLYDLTARRGIRVVRTE